MRQPAKLIAKSLLDPVEVTRHRLKVMRHQDVTIFSGHAKNFRIECAVGNYPKRVSKIDGRFFRRKPFPISGFRLASA